MRQALLALLLVFLPSLSFAQEALETVEDLQKRYEQLQPEEREHWSFLNQIARSERDLIALLGRAKEAEEIAARSPDDQQLRARADDLSAEAKQRTAAHEAEVPGYQKRYMTHMRKLQAIFQSLEKLRQKTPTDEKVSIFRIRFLADQGVFTEIRDEVETLYKAHPEDREVSFAYAETLLVVPMPPAQPQQRRPAPEPRSPNFEKAFELLAPLVKAEPGSRELQLLYGVAASALDKNAEAKAALESAAPITSLRPAVRILIGNAQDPEEAFAVWHDTASALVKDAADAVSRRTRAQLLLSVDAPARAAADAEIALTAKPEDRETQKLLARAYTRTRNFDKAAPFYKALAHEMEVDDELRAEHAIFFVNSEKFGEALDELEKIHDVSKFPPNLMELLRRMVFDLVKKLPGDLRLDAFRLRCAADQGALAAVRDEAEKLYRAHPEDRGLRWIYAQTLMCVPVPEQDPRAGRPIEPRAPRFDKVHELMSSLVKDDPRNKEYLLIYGVAACALGKDAEAKSALDAVASVASIRPALRNLIGSTRDPHGVFRRWHECASGLASKPEDVSLHKKRADLLVNVDAARLAMRDLEIVLKASPEDKETRELAARCYSSVNSYDRAVAALAPLIDDKTGEDVRSSYAAAAWNSNHPAEFKAQLAKLTDKNAAIRKLAPATAQVLQSRPGEIDALVAKWEAEEAARAADKKRGDNPLIQLETDKGDIQLELFEDTAPNTVMNFVSLVEKGFYDGVKFHRIITGFMAQGGDPTGTGMGGCGYNIKDELEKNTRFHWRGTLSMAKTSQPNSGNSQFFICFAPTPHLNGRHTVFGRAVEGQDVVDRLEKDDAIKKATVLRKRAHEYKPETITVPGQAPSKPAEK